MTRRKTYSFKLDLVKLIGGIVALVFLLKGNTHAAAWAIWVVAMFQLEVS